MATEDTTQNNSSTTDDTSEQEQQGQQQTTTEDTSGQESQQTTTPVIDKDTKLPEDHPVVKQLAADKEKLRKAQTELTELRSKSAKVTQLETDLAARPTTEAVETLQKRYDRLEEFLGAVGGPLSKALDSRTFTRDLFETDKDIEGLVKDWHRANPTATSSALASTAGGNTGGNGKVDPNVLIRAAFNGS
jgi:hypothetical protein